MTPGALGITVLGCAGTYAGPGNACSGYLVRAGGTAIWVDTGPGTLAALQAHVAPADLTAVVITHAHPDHWLDLPVFRNACKYVLGLSGVAVYAPGPVRAAADTLVDDLDATFDWHTVVDGDTVMVGGVAVDFSRTDHPAETLAMRFSSPGAGAGAGAIGYSADTGPGWSMAAFPGPVDLALWEATLLGRTPAGATHTAAFDAGRLAAEAGVGRLVLTHLLPGADPARAGEEGSDGFGGPVEVATPGATYSLT